MLDLWQRTLPQGGTEQHALRGAGHVAECLYCGCQCRYQDLVDDEEHDRLLKTLAVLEKKDEMAQRMEAVTK